MMDEKNDRDKDIEALMSDEKEEVSKDFKEDPSLSKYPSWLKEKYTKLIREKAIKAVKDQMISNRTKPSDYSKEEMEELLAHEEVKAGEIDLYGRVLRFKSNDNLDLNETDSTYLKGEVYDLAILVYDSSCNAGFERLRKFAGQVKADKEVMMDLNMTMSVRKGQLQRYFRTLYESRLFYTQEPLLIFSELWRGLRTLAVRAKSKFFGTH